MAVAGFSAALAATLDPPAIIFAVLMVFVVVALSLVASRVRGGPHLSHWGGAAALSACTAQSADDGRSPAWLSPPRS